MARNTTIIAEIGENHLGNMDMAKAMIVAAADFGADIVKFQSYRGAHTRPDDPERRFFEKVELSDEIHFELRDLAAEKNVRFMSSPFNVERARFLVEQVGSREIKVASGKMHNAKLLDYLNSRHDSVKTVYLSTGMATLPMIRQSVERLKDIDRVVILHCVAVYPLKDEDANLRAITTLRCEFPDYEIGYSDHTCGLQACTAAVALGATVLEKHLTFNTLMPGTDHVGAMTPQDLGFLAEWVERIESMLGTGEKAPSEEEKKVMDLMRDRFGD